MGLNYLGIWKLSFKEKLTNVANSQVSYDVKIPTMIRIGYIRKSYDRNNVMTVKNDATAAGSEVWFEPLVHKSSQEWRVIYYRRTPLFIHWILLNPSSNKILAFSNNKLTIESKQ